MKTERNDEVALILGGVTVVTSFMTESEATDLFNQCNTLRFIRKQQRGGKARHATFAFTSAHDTRANKAGAVLDLTTAPTAITRLAKRLTTRTGKDINYLAVVRYENGSDYFNWHQHESDKDGRDMSVYIVSIGAERALSIRPVGGKRQDILADGFTDHPAIGIQHDPRTRGARGQKLHGRALRHQREAHSDKTAT
jgi:hypothetical protein